MTLKYCGMDPKEFDRLSPNEDKAAEAVRLGLVDRMFSDGDILQKMTLIKQLREVAGDVPPDSILFNLGPHEANRAIYFLIEAGYIVDQSKRGYDYARGDF